MKIYFPLYNLSAIDMLPLPHTFYSSEHLIFVSASSILYADTIILYPALFE